MALAAFSKCSESCFARSNERRANYQARRTRLREFGAGGFGTGGRGSWGIYNSSSQTDTETLDSKQTRHHHLAARPYTTFPSIQHPMHPTTSLGSDRCEIEAGETTISRTRRIQPHPSAPFSSIRPRERELWLVTLATTRSGSPPPFRPLAPQPRGEEADETCIRSTGSRACHLFCRGIHLEAKARVEGAKRGGGGQGKEKVANRTIV